MKFDRKRKVFWIYGREEKYKRRIYDKDDRGVAWRTALLWALGKRVSLHQDRIPDVCDRRGGYGITDPVCRLPFYACRNSHYYN